MELKIIQETENPLFGRKEIVASVASEIAPPRTEILSALSKKFSVPEENVKIKRILGNFGSKEFDVMANVYSSADEKNAVEIKKKKEAEAEKRMAEAAKAAETPEEPKAEEKIVEEEKKETGENKAEEKTE